MPRPSVAALLAFGPMALALTVLCVVAGCDPVGPAFTPRVVVEAFLDAGRPLPDVLLRTTRAPGDGGADDVLADAAVTLDADGRTTRLLPVPGQPGRYRAADASGVVAGRVYGLSVAAPGLPSASARTVVPPSLTIDSVAIEPAERTIRAVLLDSLRLDPGPAPPVGFVYPVEVRVYWRAPDAPADTFSVRAQLRPTAADGARFFFPPEALLRENALPSPGGARVFVGVYAVPVATQQAPLPEHALRIALVRGAGDYARFIASRDAPDRREPVSNVRGGRGVFAGVSVDTVRVRVTAADARRLN